MDDNDVKSMLESIKIELIGKIDALSAKLDEKNIRIDELESKIVLLDEKLSYSDKKFELLERRLDDYEQYGRRTSLRINGVKYAENENADDCLGKVKKVIQNLGIELDERDFDRAHRVSKPFDREGNPVKDRQIIVKFTSFRVRTKVYRNRGKDAGKPRFYLDQTLRRYQLRQMAVEYVKNKPNVHFVFVDVNCNLCVRMNSGQFKFFNSEEELIKIVG